LVAAGGVHPGRRLDHLRTRRLLRTPPLGETLAEQFHTRHLPASDPAHASPISNDAATLPLPHLTQPTLINPDGRRAA
jgi:hypothetical protein